MSAAVDALAPVLGRSPRILVIRLRRFGDLLLITPTLRAIRTTYPEARLEVLVSAGFHQVLVGNPHLDALLVLEPGGAGWRRMVRRCYRGGYDAVLDLQSSSRSLFFALATRAPVRVGWQKRGVRDWAYNRLVPGWDAPLYVARNNLRLAASFGVSAPADLRLELAVSATDRARAAALLDAAGVSPERPLVALSVVANMPHKRWPAERYAALADRLVQTHGAQLILTSGAGEVDQVRAVVTQMQQRPALWNYGRTTIQELGALYERCDLWIGNDGGPKHVASAVGCPTVVIIKDGDERFWTDAADVMQMAVHRPPAAGAPDLSAVTVDDVLAAAAAHLGRRVPRQRDGGRSGLAVP